jgi:hypothetical protein
VNSSQGGGSKDTWVLASARSGLIQQNQLQSVVITARSSGPEVTALGRQSGPDQ